MREQKGSKVKLVMPILHSGIPELVLSTEEMGENAANLS